jgi:FkbM family methyltransferase
MNAEYVIKYARYRYMLLRILLRFKMGRIARNEYLQKRGITYLEFLPELLYAGKVCKKNGINAIPRPNSDDFYVLFIDKEIELRPHMYMNSGETFVDVGANVGFYSLRIAKDFGHMVKVIAIEAHPGNYEAMRRNIACNNLGNIEPINKAVSNHRGKISIYEHENKSRTGQFSLSPRSENDVPCRSKVECDTLDSILLNRQCNILKIDIEGEEVNALKAAEETLRKTRKVIVEIHGENLLPVKDILEESGFKVEITGSGVMKYIIGSKIR